MENGAQVIQVFESWAHQMIPQQFETFAKPYADLAMSILKKRFPDVPVIFFANGGSSYLESQRDTQARIVFVVFVVVVVVVLVCLGKGMLFLAQILRIPGDCVCR